MKNEYRVVTPESVEFVYELAGLGSRMMAAIFDHLIVLGLLLSVWAGVVVFSLFGCFLTGGVLLLLTGGPLVAFALLSSFLVYFGYFVFHEVRSNGQTPGKRVLEIRVIDDRGTNLDVFQSLLRNLFRLVDMMPILGVVPGFDFMSVGLYAVGGIAAFIHPSHKRLGDWAGGTLVVRTRKRIVPEAIVAPNDRYNSLLENATIGARIRSQLDLEERETLLQLCLRRNELDYETRSRLFKEAADLLATRLEISREEFISEEKFVQNITAAALLNASKPVLPGRTRKSGLANYSQPTTKSELGFSSAKEPDSKAVR